MNALVRFAIGGVLGYVLENVATGEPRRSAIVPEGIPFLPVYGAGLALIGEIAPRIRRYPVETRAAAYAAILTSLELAACRAERAEGRMSWAYDAGACVDLPHALMWALLGLLSERLP